MTLESVARRYAARLLDSLRDGTLDIGLFDLSASYRHEVDAGGDCAGTVFADMLDGCGTSHSTIDGTVTATRGGRGASADVDCRTDAAAILHGGYMHANGR